MTRRDRSSDRLLMRSDQLELIDRSLEQQAIEQQRDDVDDARRARYLERLREALPELRKIEGFPIGTDEAILALSDPPYYTACPNPFLADFIAEHGTPYDEATDDYHREPFAADVSEGKNDPIYNAHSYHTKVPHKAIMRYLLHYTKPGDVVFDGFGGTGMTGVAAELCGSPDPDFKATVEAEWEAAGHLPPRWGARTAILNDLSPAATFIAYNYNTPVVPKAFRPVLDRAIAEAERELGRLYETAHVDGSRGRIHYTIWSDVYACPSCSSDVVFWNAAVDEAAEKVRSIFACPTCGSSLTRAGLERSWESVLDPILGEVVRLPRQVPVQIVYEAMGRRFTKVPDESDRRLATEALSALRQGSLTGSPIEPGDEADRNRALGFTAQHHFLQWRTIASIVALWSRLDAHPRLLSVLTSALPALTKMNRWPRQRGPLNGTLYVPAICYEYNPMSFLRKRGPVQVTARPSGLVSTQSAGDLAQVPPNTFDYCFTDPPFGSNLQYFDLNGLLESLLGVRTEWKAEAVTSRTQAKGLPQYQDLMLRCFREAHRVLKPGRWITVEFHNSSNAVWNSIQEAIQRARFVVADVRTIDKQQGSFKQIMTTGAVKQDLVISAYKPRTVFESRFAVEAGTEQGAWDFIREHLGQLPVFVDLNGRVEVVAERQNYLLYDRMVAFHIQRAVTVPLSAGRFYSGLSQRFLERDDMYFTELQAAEYDRRRLEARDIEQLSVFVVDEKSAIQWIRAELLAQPQTFQDLQPKFLRELNQNRFEELPELRDILDQNFLEDASSHNWRVPDPGKQADLEALRTRSLLNEFATYVTGTAKIKRFRLEAVRAGFADLWAKRDYRAIIKLADRLPDEVVQEDAALLMYYDNAVTREGAE